MWFCIDVAVIVVVTEVVKGTFVNLNRFSNKILTENEKRIKRKKIKKFNPLSAYFMQASQRSYYGFKLILYHPILFGSPRC